ncbi:dienelactone hydrolase family protein [Halomonas sp. DP4Y7-1]|nr:dienelactone hydrolase family protein [Halomonas sp. DP4Y7-2]MBY6231676.1 dienelactone hydrolase family protein [Halomonas sp. DP4Y7-1]
MSENLLSDIFGQELRRQSPFHGEHHGQWEGIGPCILAGPASDDLLLLTHGAGAGHDSPFLVAWRKALADAGVATLSVEFAYMRQMKALGRRRPPPKVDLLVDELRTWRDVLSHSVPGRLWLGGKSMGGRVATLLAAEETAPGVVVAGYPFHPQGKPERLRLAHWPRLKCPTLVLQGTRDPFGTLEQVQGYDLPEVATVEWLEDGDHDWLTRRASGVTRDELMQRAAKCAATLMQVN